VADFDSSGVDNHDDLRLLDLAEVAGWDNMGAGRIADDKPSETLAAATLIAAVQVLQWVHDCEGTAGRQLKDVFDPHDQPALAAVCATLEGKTACHLLHRRTLPSPHFVARHRLARSLRRQRRPQMPSCATAKSLLV
jgi:hypothetical protein